MSDVVERAKAALEGVTEGPWDHAEAFDASFVCAGDGGTVAQSWIVRLDNRPGRVKDKRDAEFIAACRELVPELVAELESARNLIAALEVGQDNSGVLLAKAAEQYDALVAEIERLRAHAGNIVAYAATRRPVKVGAP